MCGIAETHSSMRRNCARKRATSSPEGAGRSEPTSAAILPACSARKMASCRSRSSRPRRPLRRRSFSVAQAGLTGRPKSSMRIPLLMPAVGPIRPSGSSNVSPTVTQPARQALALRTREVCSRDRAVVLLATGCRWRGRKRTDPEGPVPFIPVVARDGLEPPTRGFQSAR